MSAGRRGRSFLKHLTWSVVILNFGWLSLPQRGGAGQTGVNYTTCDDGYAIRIPAGELHTGAYLACEDYDLYYDLMRARDRDGAEKLLLTSAPSVYDKRINKER